MIVLILGGEHIGGAAGRWPLAALAGPLAKRIGGRYNRNNRNIVNSYAARLTMRRRVVCLNSEETTNDTNARGNDYDDQSARCRS